MNTAIIAKTDLTMTSREIAALTGKDHGKVCRDFRNQCEKLEISQSRYGSAYVDKQGKERTEYLLDHIQTMNLITGYSVVLRDKVNRRWIELEQAAEENNWQVTRRDTRYVWFSAQEAIKLNYGDPDRRVYASEQNMIYITVFGMTAKEIKIERGAKKSQTAKDVMTRAELEQVAAMELANTTFLAANMDKATRSAGLAAMVANRRKKLS